MNLTKRPGYVRIILNLYLVQKCTAQVNITVNDTSIKKIFRMKRLRRNCQYTFNMAQLSRRELFWIPTLRSS